MDAGVFVAVFFALIIPFLLSERDLKAEEEKARERRLAAHRMNASLLKLNI